MESKKNIFQTCQAVAVSLLGVGATFLTRPDEEVSLSTTY